MTETPNTFWDHFKRWVKLFMEIFSLFLKFWWIALTFPVKLVLDCVFAASILVWFEE